MAMILIEKNVMVPMRDGVQLATDVYRLNGEVPAPVLLTRTPYNKEYTLAGTSTFDILRAVQAGYDEPPDVYLYNPMRPVPTIGGQVILPGGNATGPRDQRDVEVRDDVLVYSTQVLNQA